MPNCTSFMLCTSPRSGSTLLCRLLEGTGQSGVPDSYFHDPSLGTWMRDYDLAEEDFATPRQAVQAVVDAARAAGTCKAGLFGLRMQQHSLAFFLQQLAVLHPDPKDDLARIEAAFGPTRFIYLHRADKLAQAISYVKAEQSGLWHKAPDGREIERLAPHRDPVYDHAAITRQIDEFTRADTDWEAWFARLKIAPLRLDYDRLAGDPRGALREVLTDLGITPSLADAAPVPVAKLADQVSRDWAERFRADQS